MAHAALTIDSPIGPIQLAASARGLTRVRIAGTRPLPRESAPPDAAARRHLAAAARALEAYFAGAPGDFAELELAAEGTPFQKRVWGALRRIPRGQTRSYGWVAESVGSPRAARAVGMANHRNPLGIVVPCHRVVGADGSLVGYAGGLDRKRWLLAHETQPGAR